MIKTLLSVVVFFVSIATAFAADAAPLKGDWKPDDDSRANIQLAPVGDAAADTRNGLRIIARNGGSACSGLLPLPKDRTGDITFRYHASEDIKSATLIVQSLNKSYGGVDYLTFDLDPTKTPRELKQSFKVGEAAASVLLRFKVQGSGTLAVEGLQYGDRLVSNNIVSGRLGVGATVDPKADAKPVSQASVALNEPRVAAWSQVFIGGAGTVRTIKVHPVDGTVVTGADVSGPFYWDAKTDLPPDHSMPISGFPNLTWTMDPTSWRATMDMLGSDSYGLIHTDQISFDPTNADILYFVGGKQWLAGQGVLVTRDRGKSWAHAPLKRPDGKNVFIDNASSVERLKVDPTYPSTVYYGSRRDGLYRSTDSGASWTLVESFPESSIKFTDYGATWIQFAEIDGKRTTLVAAVPSSKESSFKAAVYASEDQGATWRKTDLPVSGIGIIDPFFGKTLYSSSKKVLKTDLATGKTTDITPLELGPGKGKGWDYSPVAVSPENPDWLVVFTREYSEGRFFRSRDGGNTWESFHTHDHRGSEPKITFECLPYYPTVSGGEHAFNAVWDCAFDPKQPSRLWMATWPGVEKTEDAWAVHPKFRQMGEGHEEVCLFDLISPSRGAPLISGMMDVGGFVHQRLDMPPATGMVGVKPEGPHGQTAPSEVTSLDFCESNPEIIVSAVCWRYFPPPDGNGTGHARITEDGGKSWRRLGEVSDEKRARDGRIAINPKNPDNLVWMPRNDGNTGVYFSRDRGKSWERSKGAPTGHIWPDLVFSFYKPLAADRVDDGKFYIYDKRDGRFYRSEDGGANWKHVSRLPAVGGEHFKYHRIAAVPGNAGVVWAALQDKGLFISSNSGDAWTQLEGVEEAIDVAFGPASVPDKPMVVYFLGRIRGETDSARSVYRSDDDGKTWTRIDDASLGWASAVCLTADRQTPGRVYVGTNGRGIYVATSEGK